MKEYRLKVKYYDNGVYDVYVPIEILQCKDLFKSIKTVIYFLKLNEKTEHLMFYKVNNQAYIINIHKTIDENDFLIYIRKACEEEEIC